MKGCEIVITGATNESSFQCRAKKMSELSCLAGSEGRIRAAVTTLRREVR